ncbi:hypothetical protein [Actinomadura sediminis]|uniref:Uncharacterized protein n=1 Tax=Actinomadura sediminis TaxID=1038904 RepID=A0ABW3ELY7_9ACTN
MSHFTRVRTRFADGTVPRRAPAGMGREARPVGPGVRGRAGRHANAEFEVCPDGGEHETGFVNGANGYEAVADSTLRKRGFEVYSGNTEKSGDIRVVLRRAGA